MKTGRRQFCNAQHLLRSRRFITLVVTNLSESAEKLAARKLYYNVVFIYALLKLMARLSFRFLIRSFEMRRVIARHFEPSARKIHLHTFVHVK